MYTLNLSVVNMKTGEVCRKETVKFYGLWYARMYARLSAACVDIANAMVVDDETGEIMLEVDGDGRVLIDSEG